MCVCVCARACVCVCVCLYKLEKDSFDKRALCIDICSTMTAVCIKIEKQHISLGCCNTQ